MAYTALYRKLRPISFDGVVGQEHIVRTLTNQILASRISHAYLFCGTRGTGKTSTAKIFARTINCESPVNGNPCNECETCKAILSGISMNVIEIDAASNNGVDNIRDLREEVKYPPTSGKFKVYIIDEVHMLSTGAFNALLKTLEEPPEHVIFILATTDPQKIPPTIHSRCQRFDFRRVSAVEMAQALKQYMEQENVAVDDNALSYIARISDGAMRDALSILDQCISFYYNEQITLEKVLDIMGSVDNTVFFKLTDALFAGDTSLCISIIDEIIIKGRDVNQFVTEFVVHLRNLLVSISSPDSETALDYSSENKKMLLSQSKTLSDNVIINYINVFSELHSRLKYASNDRILLEVACIRLCNPDEPEEALTKTEPQRKSESQKVTEKVKPPEPPVNKKAIPDDIKAVGKGWLKFIGSFPQPDASYLQNTNAGYLNDGLLYIVCDNIGFVSIIQKKEEFIKQKLSETFKKDFDVRTIHKSLYNQNHKELYGSEDSFDFDDGIADMAGKINFEIEIV